MLVLLNFINLFVIVFQVLLLIRVVMSWITPTLSGWFGRLLLDLTEPVLAPIRRLLPKSQFFDFSPLVAFILLQLLSIGANNALG